ncbi:conserved hypothetical protein [Trichinella spiralis]|uniref:hypothetical protein n=1 Tax=Trichinella spiralis TaxID=6334 RepID=UPI0001EFDCD8|nr:conserved hypothetical protein [Trichinella spiralis]
MNNSLLQSTTSKIIKFRLIFITNFQSPNRTSKSSAAVVKSMPAIHPVDDERKGIPSHSLSLPTSFFLLNERSSCHSNPGNNFLYNQSVLILQRSLYTVSYLLKKSGRTTAPDNPLIIHASIQLHNLGQYYTENAI